MNNDYEYEIDLVDLIKYILKKWKIILACAIAFCLILAGYALLKTKTYYRAQVTMTVQTEVSGNPVEKLGVFNRSDVVQAALKDARSSTSVSEASKWISVSRTPYTNKISLTYSSTKDEAVSVLSSLARKSGETINAISGYKVLANSNRVTSLSSVKNGPSLKKYSVLGVLAGAFLCAFAHMLRYIFEDKVRNINFVENVLGYKVLAKFDGEKDDYANLCANLKYGFKDTKIISVSAFEKEGKNVAGKLAEALSQTGKRVLYVKENVSGEEPNVIDLNTILLSDKAVVKARSEVETVVYTCTEDLTVLWIGRAHV